jgi:hypothetical protein
MSTLKPTTCKPRTILDLNQRNGQFMHPPRLPEIGGANSLHKPGGPKQNDMKLSRVGNKR